MTAKPSVPVTVRPIFRAFEQLAGASGSIPKLRELILQLAMQGRLVRHDSDDQDASAVRREMHAKKASLVASRQIPRPAAIEPIDGRAGPFELPQNWCWIRLGEVAAKTEYGTSHKASRDRDGIPTFRMNNILDGKLSTADLKYVPPNITDLPKLFLNSGDILFNRTNSAELVGKAAVFRGQDNHYTFASYLIRVAFLPTYAVPGFYNLAINSPYFRRTQIEPEVTQQCGQANFNGTKLANAVVPFPPLAEQKRIVAKVEQLLALCDELETRLKDADARRERLLTAAVHDLLSQPAC